MTSEELLNRLLSFAKQNQQLVKILPVTVYNREYGGQLIRSSASPGSNYIEAIEASSSKDFVHRLKICRKETKESIYWLTLIQGANEGFPALKEKAEELIKEARELIKIFTSSVITSERNQKMKNGK